MFFEVIWNSFQKSILLTLWKLVGNFNQIKKGNFIRTTTFYKSKHIFTWMFINFAEWFFQMKCVLHKFCFIYLVEIAALFSNVISNFICTCLVLCHSSEIVEIIQRVDHYKGNKRFRLNKMFQWNALKIFIFNVLENPCSYFYFTFCAIFLFPLSIHKGIRVKAKLHEMKNENTNYMGFLINEI